MIPSNHLILCRLLLLLSSDFPRCMVFSSKPALCIMGPKDWSFSFGIILSNEYSGLFSFWIDWFNLAVQGTLKSLLQHHDLKALILWHSAFFMVQLTSIHDYWKNHSFVYTDICWQSGISAILVCHSFSCKEQASFNFVTAVTIHSDFGAQENKICHCFHFFPSICQEVMGLDATILVFWMLSFKPAFSLCSFTLIKKLFSSPSLSTIWVVSSWELRLLVCLPAILIPACASFSLAFYMICNLHLR